MHINKQWLLTGVAVVAALGVGFDGAQRLDRPTAGAEAEHTDKGHEEDEGGAFVSITAQAAESAGIAVVAVEPILASK